MFKIENDNKELQMQVFKLTSELNNFEFEKIQLEKTVSQDSQSKNLLVNELEHFQQNIRNLEDIKEKNENKFKDHIKQLNEDVHELDLLNNQLKEQKTQLEKEFNELKVSFNRKIKEVQDKSKTDGLNKEKEMQQYKDRIEILDKERENYKNDSEIYKKNSEKLKVDFKELREQIKKIIEDHEIEKKKWEDKMGHNEKRFENEKKTFLEQISSLNLKISAEVSKKSINQIPLEEVANQDQNTLMDVLDDDYVPNLPSNEVTNLKNEISALSNEIIELKSRVYSLQKISSDFEINKKEILKLKNDINEITEMYENQIKELQQKEILINAELQSSRKRNTRKSSALDKNQVQFLVELEDSCTRLTAENKFLEEKIDILEK